MEFGHRLDVPREHLVALHARDFARAAQQQRHAAQLALHDLEIEQRDLAHQAGADADLREHFGGVKQFAFGLGPRLFPRQLHRAIRRQVAGEVAARALGPGRAGELELACPRPAPAGRSVAAALGATWKSTAFHGSFWRTAALNLSWMGNLPRWSNTATKRFCCTWMRHSGVRAASVSATAPESNSSEPPLESSTCAVAGQGEGGLVAAEIADELEVVEGDRRGGRRVGCGVRGDGAGRRRAGRVSYDERIGVCESSFAVHSGQSR